MKNWIQLTAMETQDSSDPAGNLTTNFDPARSSWSLRGRNRQMTRIVSSRGISPPSTPSPGKSTEDIFISSGTSDSGKTHDTTSLTKLHAKLWPGASKERKFNLFRESAKLQSLWYNFFEFNVSYWNLGGFFFVFNFVGGFLSSSLCPSSHSLLLTNASPLPFVHSFASTFLCFTLSMGVYRIRCTPIYSTFSTLS